MKPIAILTVALLLGGAFYAGRLSVTPGPETAPVAAGPDASTGNAPEVETSEGLTGEREAAPQDPELQGRPVEPAPAESVAPPAEAEKREPPMVVPPAVPEVVKDFDIETLETGQQALALFQAFARTQFKRGAEGHLAIVGAMDAVLQERELMRTLGRRDEDVAKHIYPLVRFLVQNEADVAATGQTVFKTMADDPMAFEAMDDDTLEIFTEGLGPLLPAILPESEMQKLTAYAQKVLETPEEQQSRAVQRNRGRLERLLRAWAPPLAPAAAAEAIRKLEPDAKQVGALVPLFTNLTGAHVREFDLHAYLAVMIERGDRRAMSLIPEDVSPAERDIYDEAVLRGMRSERLPAWNLSGYVRASGRKTWGEMRDFVESLLAAGVSAQTLLNTLARSSPRPDRDWMVSAMNRYQVPESTRSSILRRYPE